MPCDLRPPHDTAQDYRDSQIVVSFVDIFTRVKGLWSCPIVEFTSVGRQLFIIVGVVSMDVAHDIDTDTNLD